MKPTNAKYEGEQVFLLALFCVFATSTDSFHFCHFLLKHLIAAFGLSLFLCLTPFLSFFGGGCSSSIASHIIVVYFSYYVLPFFPLYFCNNCVTWDIWGFFFSPRRVLDFDPMGVQGLRQIHFLITKIIVSCSPIKHTYIHYEQILSD